MKYYHKYDSPAGEIWISEEESSICSISTSCPATDHSKPELTPVIKKAMDQLSEYFAGKRKDFDLPLCLDGTPFQNEVWQALCRIPYGETKSYKDVAEMIGNPRSCRAVGMANNRNRIMIVVPCHRVIGSNGTMTGYAGGIEMKEFLLDLEKKNI